VTDLERENNYACARIKEDQERGTSIFYDPANDRAPDGRRLDDRLYDWTQEKRSPLLYPKEKK